jgi:uncharacterized protein YdeI (YjbR/CyaY-like superfamily)
MDEGEPLELESAAQWRRWLEEHHAGTRGVWLVLQKKASRRPGPRYEEAVEEALCFGWIDSKLRRLDEERAVQWFSPRKATSIWSKSNVARVERLIEQGRMTPAGLAVVEEAKRRGSWQRPMGGRESLEIPPDLQEALEQGGAVERFQAFAPSYRQIYLYWVAAARTAPTRDKRIAKVVEFALEGRKPGIL